ncbi:MAG: CoA-binding protein [Actinomycetota bacterium]
MNTWTPPTAAERKAILDRTRSIGIVGASTNPARASNFVITYLKSWSDDVELYPINPREETILDLPCYPSISALPVVPDLVSVFRRAEDCPAVAREAAEAGVKTLWLQLGIESAEAAEIALAAGMDVVMDRCVKIEHARFAGGLHLAGFNTGVITSRRR